MAFDATQARRDLLEAVHEATAELATALAALTEAFDQLDEAAADRLEAELFRPVQLGLGRLRRTHAAFSERYGLGVDPVDPSAIPPPPSVGAKGAIEEAAAAVHRADDVLSTLQDSMLPVEVGDPELRAGLAEARTLIGDAPGKAEDLLRVVGR